MLLNKMFDVSGDSIGDLLHVCPDSWEDVGIGDTLNMASGHYHTGDWMADENSSRSNAFFFATSREDKLAAACSLWPAQNSAGTNWVYHSSDTFLAVAAMDQWLREQDQQEADLWRLMVKRLWQPAQLSEAATISHRSYDTAEQAYGYNGLSFVADDLARR